MASTSVDVSLKKQEDTIADLRSSQEDRASVSRVAEEVYDSAQDQRDMRRLGKRQELKVTSRAFNAFLGETNPI